MKKRLILFLFIFSLWSQGYSQKLNISGGHSHNDYERSSPLTEALSNHLVSIEADIYPVNGVLLVGHDRKDLDTSKTLENLYLAPLWKLHSKNKLDHLLLLIDIKTDGEKTYFLLKELLQKYIDMLTMYYPDSIQQSEISVVLSGDRPWSLLSENKRMAALDGKFDTISFKLGYTYFPLISDSWESFFKWNGNGEMGSLETKKLTDMIQRCHIQHKLIRFWEIPIHKPEVIKCWELFNLYGVDLLGVDVPSDYSHFIITK